MNNIPSGVDRRPRVERWPTLLRKVISFHSSAPFEWRVSDCAMLFADAVQEMTGFDPIFDGRDYSDMQSALRCVRRAGFRSMAELVAARFPEISPAEAQRGDLGYTADTDPLMCPCVIDGAFAHAKALSGPVLIPRGQIVRAFAV